MEVTICGKEIYDERDFHEQLADALGIQAYYGKNLDALRDLLEGGLERPVNFIWVDSAVSKTKLGDSFEKIVSILERVKLQDERYGWTDKFTYSLV
ncbi:barstar family protein [Burkholderia sp. MSMB1835]|uniref:barstar family protein n=1 Tax=Burkholderia sp. MSMB1835 TaxID=1637876 RepID=UPI0009E82090|nr:barstar family protein [Burkholderia sp. MSMB1835]